MSWANVESQGTNAQSYPDSYSNDDASTKDDSSSKEFIETTGKVSEKTGLDEASAKLLVLSSGEDKAELKDLAFLTSLNDKIEGFMAIKKDLGVSKIDNAAYDLLSAGADGKADSAVAQALVDNGTLEIKDGELRIKDEEKARAHAAELQANGGNHQAALALSTANS